MEFPIRAQRLESAENHRINWGQIRPVRNPNRAHVKPAVIHAPQIVVRPGEILGQKSRGSPKRPDVRHPPGRRDHVVTIREHVPKTQRDQFRHLLVRRDWLFLPVRAGTRYSQDIKWKERRRGWAKRMFCEGTESRCRIPTCRADGLSRDLSMTNEERKRKKAVKKIEIAVRKADRKREV